MNSNKSLKSVKSIKSMKLYQHVERVERELRARGLNDDVLDVADLEALDQLHYHGRLAVLEAIKILGLNSESSVIDVGSGLGGPARILASEAGCHVTAVELQGDLDQLASSLTKRCRLNDRVAHCHADFMSYEFPDAAYDALVSWLTFLHIPDRERLLERCVQSLRPGGQIFVEDFFARRSLEPDESELLAQEVFCQRLDSLPSYREQIEGAGFGRLECHDMTESWTSFVHDRLDAFRNDRIRFTELHGEAAYQGLDTFYTAMNRLFSSGALGGLRWTAQRL